MTKFSRKSLMSRVVSAAIGIPILSGAIFLGGLWFSGLLAILAALGATELCALMKRRGRNPSAKPSAVWAFCVVLMVHFIFVESTRVGIQTGVLGAVSVASGIYLLTRVRTWTDVKDLGLTWVTAITVGIPLSHGALIRSQPEGLQWVVLVCLVTFATDTAAFVIGNSIGRKKLAPTVSPNKTWEGAIAGLVAATIVMLVLRYAFEIMISVNLTILLGIIISVTGLLGDLLESKLKRIANVKDSGNLIPGHGGILDRIDSIVPNIVLVYYLLIWVVQ